jgi:hypothetical protein
VRFVGGGAGWAWLRTGAEKSKLYTAPPDGSAQVVAEGAGWTDLAAEGNTLWVADGKSGTILEVPGAASSTPKALVEKLSEPGGLAVKGGTLYWAERIVSPTARYPWVPTTGPRIRISSRNSAGAIQQLGECPAAAGPFSPGPGDIQLASDAIYLRVRRPATTEFLRFPLAGGAPTRVAIEPDVQQAVAAGSDLYWSAPSPETSETAHVVAVKRWGPGKPATMLCDWLPGDGRMVLLNGVPHWVAVNLYSFPTSPGQPTIVKRLGWMAKDSDGSRVVDLVDPRGPRTLVGSR